MKRAVVGCVVADAVDLWESLSHSIAPPVQISSGSLESISLSGL